LFSKERKGNTNNKTNIATSDRIGKIEKPKRSKKKRERKAKNNPTQTQPAAESKKTNLQKNQQKYNKKIEKQSPKNEHSKQARKERKKEKEEKKNDNKETTPANMFTLNDYFLKLKGQSLGIKDRGHIFL